MFRRDLGLAFGNAGHNGRDGRALWGAPFGWRGFRKGRIAGALEVRFGDRGGRVRRGSGVFGGKWVHLERRIKGFFLFGLGLDNAFENGFFRKYLSLLRLLGVREWD
jgi:hypothetical protein